MLNVHSYRCLKDTRDCHKQCKTFLHPSNFILLVVPRRYFCCSSICFMFWSRILVLFEPYVYVFIFLLKFG